MTNINELIFLYGTKLLGRAAARVLMAHDGPLDSLTEETLMTELVTAVEAMAAEPAELPRGLLGKSVVFLIDDMRKLDAAPAHIAKQKGPPKRIGNKHTSKWDRWS